MTPDQIPVEALLWLLPVIALGFVATRRFVR